MIGIDLILNQLVHLKKPFNNSLKGFLIETILIISSLNVVFDY